MLSSSFPIKSEECFAERKQCHVNALLTREWTVLKFTGSQLDDCVTISKGPKAVDSGCKLDNI